MDIAFAADDFLAGNKFIGAPWPNADGMAKIETETIINVDFNIILLTYALMHPQITLHETYGKFAACSSSNQGLGRVIDRIPVNTITYQDFPFACVVGGTDHSFVFHLFDQ